MGKNKEFWVELQGKCEDVKAITPRGIKKLKTGLSERVAREAIVSFFNSGIFDHGGIQTKNFTYGGMM
jgi:hypothetical protein